MTSNNNGHYRGQGLVEYALILALVAVAVIVVLTIFGPAVSNIFQNITCSIQMKADCSTPAAGIEVAQASDEALPESSEEFVDDTTPETSETAPTGGDTSSVVEDSIVDSSSDASALGGASDLSGTTPDTSTSADTSANTSETSSLSLESSTSNTNTDYSGNILAAVTGSSSLTASLQSDANSLTEDSGGESIVTDHYYLNFGATAPLTDASGNVWQIGAAIAQNGGSIQTVTSTGIGGSNTPPVCSTLIQSRSGMAGKSLDFSFDNLPAGTYTLKLYFVETETGSAQQGIFNIWVEGTKKFEDYKPLTVSGFKMAHIATTSQAISDGTLNLSLERLSGIPSICALEIIRS